MYADFHYGLYLGKRQPALFPTVGMHLFPAILNRVFFKYHFTLVTGVMCIMRIIFFLNAIVLHYG